MTLQEFFSQHPDGALAFSGGTDSAFLLWAAAKYGRNWQAYYVHSAFQPAFELADAQRLAAELDMPLTIIEGDVLSNPTVTANPADRCYHCKHMVFGAILDRARADGHTLVIDGTNASDDAGDRPGMRALRELQVRSPLRECGITKDQVRQLSRDAGLFTWDKPSYACLATRIPTGVAITEEALQNVEQGENTLADLGYRDFRIRLQGSAAVIQLPEGQLDRAWTQRDQLLSALRPIFPLVTLDLSPRVGID